MWLLVVFAGCMTLAPVDCAAQQGGPADAAALPERKSALPREALLQAREAEKHLAANAPEKAIEILRNLDRQYPNRAAVSLRLAEIYDTMGKNAHALFFYRRYVAQAGDSARVTAAERVGSLELMAGVRQQVEQVEREFGEDTRAVATPVPRVERMLATRAQDGGLVPIRGEDDLKKLEREGVPEKSPERRITLPGVTPIVLPSQQPTRTPVPAGRREQGAALTDTPSANGNLDLSAPSPSPPRRQADDEDALLAQAFRRTAENEAEQTMVEPANDTSPDPDMSISGLELTPQIAGDLTDLAPPSLSQGPRKRATVSMAENSKPPMPPAPAQTQSPIVAKREVVYTSPTPVSMSPRAISFFNVSEAPGQYALVSLVNDIPSAVVTVTISPKADGEIMSAILITGEQKRVYMRQGVYEVTANVSTTDYSPITLMNTTFDYSFSAGQQYTRRFNKTNIQQLN